MNRLHTFSACKVASLLALCLIVWFPTDCSASASAADTAASSAASIPSKGAVEEVGINAAALEWVKPSPHQIALGLPPTSISLPQLQEQDDNGYVLWGLKYGVNFSSIQQTMSPAKLAPNTFWAMTMTLSGTSGAYMGLQTNSNGTLSMIRPGFCREQFVSKRPDFLTRRSHSSEPRTRSVARSRVTRGCAGY